MASAFLDLQSTEVVTKFLRNKDTEVIDIYNFTVTKLFNNSKDLVYLPQKEKFILELLIDRISQSNKLSQKFKYSEQTWELFNFVWLNCNNDQRLLNIRAKVLSKLKFGEIFSKILDDFTAQELYRNGNLIDAFTITMNHLVNTSKIHLSDDQNLSMVKNLLVYFIQGTEYSVELQLRLINLVVLIFNLNNKAAFRYDTKHKTEFSRTCLANVLTAIGRYHDNARVKLSLKTIINKVLFYDNDSKNLVIFVEEFSKIDANKSLKDPDILYLLRSIIPKVDIKGLETIIKTLCEMFPEHSSLLLKEVTDMNKTLSVDFLSSLVEKALQKKADDSYFLILYSIKRSSDVAFKFTDQICDLCCIDNANSMSLFKGLVESYFRNREIESFIKLWSQVVNAHPNQLFESDEIINFVSLKLITLSYTQLSRFIETEIEIFKSTPGSNPIFLLSVCKGLLKGVSGSIQNSLSKTLIINLHQLKPTLISLLSFESKFAWKLNFYILSLFDFEDLLDEAKTILEKKTENDDYYYYSILRLVEQDVMLASNSFVKHFKSYYKKKSLHMFKYRIFTRFFRVIEAILDNDEIKTFVDLFVENSAETEILTVLKNTLIQTQPKIISKFIDYFINHKDSLSNLEVLSVYVYNKSQKEKILNLMLENLDKTLSKSTILKLLKLPTYKSKLETEFTSLLKLTSESDDAIVENIIDIHLKQPVESKEYLENLIIELSKMFNSLSSANCEKYYHHLKIANILIGKSNGGKFEDESNKLTLLALDKIIKILSNSSSLSTDDLCLLLNFVIEINFEAENIQIPENIKEIITNISVQHPDNIEIKNCLFGYICSLGQTYNTEYIVALYIVLNDKRNDDAMNKHFLNISQNETSIINTWFNLCESIKTCNERDFETYIKLLTFALTNVNKPEDIENVKLVHHLFVLSISQIFIKISEVKGNIIHISSFLKCLKTISSTKIWIFTQYAMELTMAFISHLSESLQREENTEIRDTYIDLCQTVSSIILYQRRRLSNRHHLITAVFVTLMKTLFANSKNIQEEGSLAFERLISNFCEPSIHNLSGRSSDHNSETTKDMELSKVLAQTRAGLRRHVPILVIDYVKFYLQFQIDLTIKSSLENSVYLMIDLLTLNELNYINKTLDNQGRLVFKNIYEEYKKFYKWNEE